MLQALVMKTKMTKRAKMKSKRQVANNTIQSSVETFIETRFDRLESKLDDFKDEINAWKQEFVK